MSTNNAKPYICVHRNSECCYIHGCRSDGDAGEASFPLVPAVCSRVQSWWQSDVGRLQCIDADNEGMLWEVRTGDKHWRLHWTRSRSVSEWWVSNPHSQLSLVVDIWHGQVFTCESSYCFQRVLAVAILSVRPSVCLSVTWVDQWNLHHRLLGRL